MTQKWKLNRLLHRILIALLFIWTIGSIWHIFTIESYPGRGYPAFVFALGGFAYFFLSAVINYFTLGRFKVFILDSVLEKK